MTKFNFYLIIFSILLTSCQSIKDGLSGKKGNNTDEFLVKKKNPLVIPPKYMELPEPKSSKIDDTSENIDQDSKIEELIKTSSGIKEVKSKNYGKAEDFVLENIK